MNKEEQKIAIAEACGWRGQPAEQSWEHKAGFPPYWRSIPMFEVETFDFFSASRIARVLLDPNNKPVFRKVYCGVINNRDWYSMMPIVEYFENTDQYKLWPIIEQSLVPFVEHLPDYLTDLNAMHDAEKGMSDDNAEKFRAWLLQVNGYNHDRVVSCTAAQRAKAFLKTIGKWKE